MPYVLKSGPPGKADFTPYGAARQAFLCHDPEMILAGPADTGKTLALLNKLHICACKYPRASIVIARRQLTDTFGTVLQTFQNKVIPQELETGQVRVYGGAKAEWFDYPNGSRIWIAGLDKAGKILSAEHDIIYVNQAEEVGLPDWEILTTRTTGRAGHMPYSQTIGDCNPAQPTHWIRTRAREGRLTFIESSHRDNPELYDQKTGNLTPEGERRIGRLHGLTGSRRLRLALGLWAAPEGAIYDVFDEERHKVKAFVPPLHWPRVVGIDPLGAFTAAVWLAYDPDSSVLNVYREYYEPFGTTTTGHVHNILEASKSEAIFAWTGGAPSERQQRLDFAGAGIPLREPGMGDLWVGIDRVYQLLKDFALVVHDSCPQLLSEIGGYRRRLKDGVPTENIEDKETFHLLDALRYAVVWLTELGGGGDQVVYRPVQIGPSY